LGTTDTAGTSAWTPVATRGRNIVRASPVLRQVGLWMLDRSPVLRAFVRQQFAASSAITYRDWVARHDTLRDADRAAIAARVAALPDRRISVVMPVFNPREQWLREAIDSVRAQLYPNWELCIADDASTAPHVGRVLAEVADDPRVKIIRRAENGHISEATNSALALATGEFVALMDHDDLLPEHALYMAAEELATHPDADLIYTDEDQINGQGLRFQPHFKTDWDPDLVRGQNMVSHLGLYRRTLLLTLGGLRGGFDGSQDHDLVLRVAEATTASRIRHIPAVLYHWRQTGQGSFSEGAPQRCAAASRRAIAEHLARADDASGSVQTHKILPLWARVARALPDPPPPVGVILRHNGDPAILRRRADALLGLSYPGLEVRILAEDPGCAAFWGRDTDPRALWSRAPAGAPPGPYINAAAAQSGGSVLLLMDAAFGAGGRDWLEEMVAQATRPEVGAVGAKLLDADGRVLHAGLVLGAGPDRAAASYEPGAGREAPGYAGRLQLLREVSAVGLACLAARRDVFLDAGGLDTDTHATAFADVDFCLRLRARGYRVVWTPFAELWRGRAASQTAEALADHGAQRRRAAAWLRARWGSVLDDDPFYNPNFALQEGTYQLAPPRRRRPWQDAQPLAC
jgi:GT2 family glycosyltransferase